MARADSVNDEEPLALDEECKPWGEFVPRPDWTQRSEADIQRAVAFGEVRQTEVDAWRILGDRFVATWGARRPGDTDMGRVMVGVWNLQDTEVEELNSRLASIADYPVEVALRTFSRADFVALTNRVLEAINTGGWSGYSVRDHAGLIFVDALPKCLSHVRAALIAATGQIPIEGAEADAVEAALVEGGFGTAGWTPASGRPEVLLRPNEVMEAGGDVGAAVTPVTSKTSLTTKTKKVSASSTLKARIKVKLSNGDRPIGKVRVYWRATSKNLKGSKVVKVTRASKGNLTLNLPKLPRGKYQLTARFVPTQKTIMKSPTSKKVSIRVV
jgi:hypothetical protein